MTLHLTQVADDVHMATGTNVNWGLVTDGDAVTLVDAGFPRDAGAVLESVSAIGRRPEDVVAVLLTHAHVDHLGGVPSVVARSGCRVLAGAAEVAHAHRDHLEQISTAQVLRQCAHPAGLRWVVQTLAACGTRLTMRLHDVEAVPEQDPVDAPGRLVAVPTPGHTSGHTAYLMPSTGVLFTGDTLVTGHPLCRHDGPQRLPAFFNHDDNGVTEAIAGLRDVPADTVVPGHGAPLGAPIADVVAAALDRTWPHG